MTRTQTTHSTLALATLAALGLAAALPQAARAQNPTDTVAYAVAPGTAGNQAFPGPLGMDFNVGSTPIDVTQLGAFAPGATGTGTYTFASDKIVSIFDRNNTTSPLATITFVAGTPDTLTGGSVFQALGVPLLLPAGFQGTIVAKGYDNADPNYNAGVANLSTNPTTTENGGGLIQFVGSSRFDNTNGQPAPQYPGFADGGPNDRYDAGTFSFTAAPEPSQFAGLGVGLLGLAGLALKARRRAR